MKNKAKLICFFALCGWLLSSVCSVPAQPKDLRTLRDDKQADGFVGVALVIGNAAYQHATKLKSPTYDAGDMGSTLSSLGFKVLRVRTDATLAEMDQAIAEFGKELAANKGVGIFYYSGHGVQSEGKNYLIPVEAEIPTEDFLKSRSLDTDVILRTMANNTKGFKIVILDACRNNPFANKWGRKGDASGGLAGIYSAPKGMLIAYATSPNDTAADGRGRNSPYTDVLLTEMVKPKVRIAEMFDNVREILDTQTNGDQTPWESTSLIGRFCFAGCDGSVKLRDPLPRRPVTPDKPQLFTSSVGMEFVKIPGKNFSMGKYEVTQEEYVKVTGRNPSYFSNCPRCPVERVSWSEVQQFISLLNSLDSTNKYRLPYQSEFEYAIRGGATTEFFWGNDEYQAGDYAWYDGNAGRRTHEVGTKKPNPYGLYDIAGNVWEWCQDGEGNGLNRVNRGGGWNYNIQGLTSAYRFNINPSNRMSHIGFRLVMNE